MLPSNVDGYRAWLPRGSCAHTLLVLGRKLNTRSPCSTSKYSQPGKTNSFPFPSPYLLVY